jgi:hypothetical protein
MCAAECDRANRARDGDLICSLRFGALMEMGIGSIQCARLARQQSRYARYVALSIITYGSKDGKFSGHMKIRHTGTM